MTNQNSDQTALLARIASALEKLADGRPAFAPFTLCDSRAYVWRAAQCRLQPVEKVARVPLGLLRGVDQVRDILLENTRRFASGLPANNALLWGARGTGKSSIVKAIHADLVSGGADGLCLIEVQREEIGSLEILLENLRALTDYRFLLFCDDLSFDQDDTAYKSLKAVLDGGLTGRPENVLLYATSNRRHLMPREMIENEAASGVMRGEAIEEKLSLSDRFGLWLGFHRTDQQTYLQMIAGYAAHFGLTFGGQDEADAKEWATTRGSRSGRVAWQFVQDLAARQGVRLR